MLRDKAYSDIGTLLYVKSGNAYEELIEIKNVPASGGDPQTLDATTLKDPVNVSILGRQEVPLQAFDYNRTATNYERVKTFCDGTAKEFLVVFSDGTGTYIKGKASTYKKEVALNSVQEATLAISAEEIVDKTASEVTAMLPVSA